MKYFTFSIDDGTIYDERTIALFNKYGIHATFNLNSGLNGFTWYKGDIPITRFNLNDVVSLYNGHEVASHTLTHPHLDQLDEWGVIREINEDIVNLNNIFSRHIRTFATPFHNSGEREINIIRNHTLLRSVRLSVIDESFKKPIDPYHYKVSALNIDRALELINDFINKKEAEIFIYAGHSYDFMLNDSWDKLEELLKILNSRNDIKVVTMDELTSLLFY